MDHFTTAGLLQAFFLTASLSAAVAPPPSPQETFRFADGFENANSLVDLVRMDRWHNVQIVPSTNRVEVTSEKIHSGTRALKLVAASGSGGTTKADIDRQLLTFKKGDDVYFSGWFYIVGGRDVSGIFLWDLESTQYYNSPGRRLYIQGGQYLASDLGKWLPEPPKFRQSPGKEVLFPKDRWCHVEIHLHLSELSDGVMEVWQDGLKVIDGRGQTLPTAEAVYDRLQVGITANSNASSETLYIDDTVLSQWSLSALLPVGEKFLRADSNGDGTIDIADPLYTFFYLFPSAKAASPVCLEALDSNDDGDVNLTDGIYTLSALFISGPVPPPPNPACGVDPTPDGLGCAASSCGP